MKCAANTGGILETRASGRVGDIIPNDKPVITFLLDNACCEYVNFIFGVELRDKGLYTAYYTDRRSTQDAIEKYRNVKYNKILYTTDISSAEDSLLDNYTIGVLRAGWDSRSIDSLYLLTERDDDGARQIRFLQNGTLSKWTFMSTGLVKDAVMSFYNDGERVYRSN